MRVQSLEILIQCQEKESMGFAKQAYIEELQFRAEQFDAGAAMECLEHKCPKIDIWYDCEECLQESQRWAEGHGFSQCVSPHIARAGTDCGQWVRLHRDRWVPSGVGHTGAQAQQVQG